MEREIFSAKRKREREKMYKELIISTVVILLVICANSITQSYTKEAVELLDEKLMELEDGIKEEQMQEELQYKMNEVMDNWKEKYNKLAYFIEHNELEKVETELTSLRANIDEEQYEEAVTSLEKGIFILNHIKEKFRLDMKNIF